MTEIQLLLLILALGRFGFETHLGNLNLKQFVSLKEKQPKKTKKLMSEEEWDKASSYSISKTKFSIFEDAFGLLIFSILLFWFFPFFFNHFDTGIKQSIWKCAIFAVLFLYVSQIHSIVFDWWRQFKLEEKFGFNKSTGKLWFKDKVIELFLSLLLGVPLLCLLIICFRYFSKISNLWWVWAFGIFFFIQLVLMVLWPKLILPLFNKLSPLGEGSLRDKLHDLSSKAGFINREIEVIDGSKRSSHSNAFFTGFGKFRKIVIYDTLIDQMEDDEIAAVLAHEIGHYKKGHIPQRLLISFFMGLAFFGFFSISLNSTHLYHGLKLNAENLHSFTPMAMAFSIFMPCITYWFAPLSNYWSRRHEYEADEFAIKIIGRDCKLIDALAKMYQENLSHPLPHPLFSFFHHSHPNFFERERAMEKNLKTL